MCIGIIGKGSYLSIAVICDIAYRARVCKRRKLCAIANGIYIPIIGNTIIESPLICECVYLSGIRVSKAIYHSITHIIKSSYLSIVSKGIGNASIIIKTFYHSPLIIFKGIDSRIVIISERCRCAIIGKGSNNTFIGKIIYGCLCVICKGCYAPTRAISKALHIPSSIIIKSSDCSAILPISNASCISKRIHRAIGLIIEIA